jgi:hypothetical protein
MQFENFDLKKIKTLNFEQQKIYISKYFIPLTNGAHCRLLNNKYDIIDKQILNDTYLNRCDKKLKKYYHEEIDELKSPVFELNKPVFYDSNINLCPQLPTYKPYKDFDDNLKSKVEIFLSFMKEVLCNQNIAIYDHLLKWISNMSKGNKNDCALVLKTLIKGVGKSTLTTMLMDYILGNDLCLETGSGPIKSNFNSILGGKLVVIFEELETFTQSEWSAVDCRLKRQITSKKITLEKKGQDPFEATNINNYILLSNHDVCDDDRRYFVLDVSTHRKGDREYWSNIYDNCFNKEVGSALYSYFREINTDKFHPQDYPITKSKLKSISKRLDTAYLFLKNEFILQNKGIKTRLVDLYNEYKVFCSEINKKPCGKLDFVSKLSEIQINYFDSGGYKKYKVSLETLKEISNKNSWITDIDEYNIDEKQEIEEIEEKVVKVNPIDFGIEIKVKSNKKKKIKVIEDPTDEELEAELNKLLGK